MARKHPVKEQETATSTSLAAQEGPALTSYARTLGDAEALILGGDISALSPPQRIEVVFRVCKSLGINPYTQPFQVVRLNGQDKLYPTKAAAEQLRLVRGVSIANIRNEIIDDIYVVTVSGHDRTGRTDQATGAVPIAGLKGEAKANALMKAETKAKRRFTLSIAGLGWMDVDDAMALGGQIVELDVDPVTGEIKDGGNQQQQPTATSNRAGRALANAAAAAQPIVVDDGELRGDNAESSSEREAETSPTDDRARRLYFAHHAALSLPPHNSDERKRINYRVWSAILGEAVESGGQLTPAQWAELAAYVEALRLTVEESDPAITIGSTITMPGSGRRMTLRMPRLWADWRDRQPPLTDGAPDDPFAEE